MSYYDHFYVFFEGYVEFYINIFVEVTQLIGSLVFNNGKDNPSEKYNAGIGKEMEYSDGKTLLKKHTGLAVIIEKI